MYMSDPVVVEMIDAIDAVRNGANEKDAMDHLLQLLVKHFGGEIGALRAKAIVVMLGMGKKTEHIACDFGIPASDRRDTLPEGLRNECSFPEIYPKSLDTDEELIMAKVEIIWFMLTNDADKKTVAEVMDIPEENLLEVSYLAKGFGDGVRTGYIDIMGELLNALLTHTELTKMEILRQFDMTEKSLNTILEEAERNKNGDSRNVRKLHEYVMAEVPEKYRKLFAVRYKRGYELGLKEGEKNAREIFMEQMGVQVNVVQIPKD